MSIYKNIKRIATKKNIQQKDIAAAFNVTENTMTNYLTGRTKIIADQVPLFAKILKVSIEELYSDSYSGKKDLEKSEDPEIKYFNCPECVEKQKRLEKAEKERDDFRQKYIECLEEMAGKKKSQLMTVVHRSGKVQNMSKSLFKSSVKPANIGT